MYAIVVIDCDGIRSFHETDDIELLEQAEKEQRFGQYGIAYETVLALPVMQAKTPLLSGYEKVLIFDLHPTKW